MTINDYFIEQAREHNRLMYRPLKQLSTNAILKKLNKQTSTKAILKKLNKQTKNFRRSRDAHFAHSDLVERNREHEKQQPTQEAQPKAEALENRTSKGKKAATAGKRKCQLHALIWRVYLYLKQTKGKATAPQIWNELRYRHTEHDTDEIIQEVTEGLIQWVSFWGNEPKFKKGCLSPTITRLKKNPPF
jgi:hypothetical protein